MTQKRHHHTSKKYERKLESDWNLTLHRKSFAYVYLFLSFSISKPLPAPFVGSQILASLSSDVCNTKECLRYPTSLPPADDAEEEGRQCGSIPFPVMMIASPLVTMTVMFIEQLIAFTRSTAGISCLTFWRFSGR